MAYHLSDSERAMLMDGACAEEYGWASKEEKEICV
jgi:hypothetical protein